MTEEQARNDPRVLAGTYRPVRNARIRGGWAVRDIKKWRATQARYDASERGRAAHVRYNVSEKGRAANARYNVSDKGRARRARYRASEKGREKGREWNAQYNGSFKGFMRRLDYDIRRQQKVATQLKEEMHVA